MKIRRYTSKLFGENTYIAHTDEHAVVIDPGAGTKAAIEEYLSAQQLQLKAILLTHGHADHVWECGQYACPVFISEPDRYRLDDPAVTTGGDRLNLLQAPALQPYLPFQKPEDLRTFSADFYSSGLTFAPGVVIRGMLLPGHSEGMTVFLLGETTWETDSQLSDDPSLQREIQAGDTVVLTGDLLFASGVGRTDLPGGDERTMRHSLRSFSNSFPPESVLLPGHGPATTLNREIMENIYLRQARRIG